jgi:hypothetical protein
MSAAQVSEQTFANGDAGAFGDVNKNALEVVEAAEGITGGGLALATALQAAESNGFEDPHGRAAQKVSGA